MLSGVHLKISFLTIWRLVVIFEMHNLQTLFLWLGAGTALIAVIWALMQTDCKKLLAWHSISQMGYILAGFGAGQAQGLTASFLHVINHGIFKSLLFLSVGSVIHVAAERDLKRLGNLAKNLPVLMILFLVGALSIAGIPPFNGFISKKLLFVSVKQSPLIYGVLWLASIGTVASFIKLSGIFRTSPGATTSPVQFQHQLSVLTYVPLGLLALFCVVTGVFGSTLTNFLSMVLFGQPATFKLSFYTPANLLDSALTLGIGSLLYKLIASARGQRVAFSMRQRYTSLDTALMWLVIGFLGLVLFALLDFIQM
jgi:multicomponent Na+:H+ antiporter subunit D